jgi:hypothetical protein
MRNVETIGEKSLMRDERFLLEFLMTSSYHVVLYWTTATTFGVHSEGRKERANENNVDDGR